MNEVETAYYTDGSSVTGPSPLPDKSPGGALRVTGSGAKLVARPGEVDRGPAIKSAADPLGDPHIARSPFDPFGHHAPTPTQHAKIAPVRDTAKLLAETIEQMVPACADRTLALRHLQETLFFATTGIESEGARYL